MTVYFAVCWCLLAAIVVCAVVTFIRVPLDYNLLTVVIDTTSI